MLQHANFLLIFSKLKLNWSEVGSFVILKKKKKHIHGPDATIQHTEQHISMLQFRFGIVLIFFLSMKH